MSFKGYTLTRCLSLVVAGRPHQRRYLLVHPSSLPQESVMETRDVILILTKSRNNLKFDIRLLVPKGRSLESKVLNLPPLLHNI